MININEKNFYNIIAIATLILGFGVFVATFYEQLWLGDMPCASCLITRQLILLVMMAACFVLRYGPRSQFVGFILIIAAIDIYMSMRHSTFHWFEFEGTEGRFMGVHMYLWGYFLQTGVVAMVGLLMCVMPKVFDFCKTIPANGRVLNNLQKFTFWAVLFLIIGNLVLSFALVGPPPLKAPYPATYWSWIENGWNW
ncbi:disulfide bond formation protein B [Vibrio sp. VB16]|uniref:disulfide bond formation protein B n=1 Tax=Vibrio sp. VB16 TaxID=2785746 RepID=UPI0018A00C78|nr:disulfide bond formation protein B [Vibrio sp. VB16]UGA55229.1 disulfide bond formation protein B [Vibrio sp. VB16]